MWVEGIIITIDEFSKVTENKEHLKKKIQSITLVGDKAKNAVNSFKLMKTFSGDVSSNSLYIIVPLKDIKTGPPKTLEKEIKRLIFEVK